MTEFNAHRIVRFDLNNLNAAGIPALLGFLGERGTGPLQFGYPQGIDLDQSGNLYVVDTTNHRIQKLAPNGDLLTSWGSPGRGEGQFLNPFAVAVDRIRGHVYVAEPENARIQIFDLNGQFLKNFGWWLRAGYNSDEGKLYRLGGLNVHDGVLHVGLSYPGTLNRLVRFTIDPEVEPAPDLGVRQILLLDSGEYLVGQDVQVRVLVGNYGGAVTGEPFDVAFYLARSPGAPTRVSLGSIVVPAGLPPGEEIVIERSFSLPSHLLGTLHAGVILDPDGTLPDPGSSTRERWTQEVLHLATQPTSYRELFSTPTFDTLPARINLIVRDDNTGVFLGYSERTGRSYHADDLLIPFPVSPPFVTDFSFKDGDAWINAAYMLTPGVVGFFAIVGSIDPPGIEFVAPRSFGYGPSWHLQGYYTGSLLSPDGQHLAAAHAMLTSSGHLTFAVHDASEINAGFVATVGADGEFSAVNVDGDHFDGASLWFSFAQRMKLLGQFQGGPLGSGSFVLEREVLQ